MAHDSWPDFENVLLRFEAAWNSEQPPDLDEFVAQQPGCLSDDLLVELCLIDMERRLQRGLGAAAEDFLQRYPHWGAALRRKLVVGEIEIRFWTAHAVTQAELNRRFPDLCPDLNSLLSPAAPAGSDEGRPPLRVGARVGRFVLGRELGAGAFSVVYSARNLPLIPRQSCHPTMG